MLNTFIYLLVIYFIYWGGEKQSLKQWQTIFFISAGVYLAVNLVYLVFGSGEEQSWNKRTDLTPSNDDEKSTKIPDESMSLN